MSDLMWKKMDAVESPPVHLRPDDVASCYYARDYVSRGGYQASEANGLISNLKKPVSTRGTGQWYYKEQAVKKFATELSNWLSDGTEEFCIAAIPSSKRRDHAEYDPRLDMVLEIFDRTCPQANVVRPIRRAVSMQAAHLSDVRPTIQEVYDSLEWDGLDFEPTGIILLDDVITAGTSYRACHRLVSENIPGCQIWGVFWARTVWPETDVDLSGLGL